MDIKSRIAELYRSVPYSMSAGVLEGALRRLMISHDGRLRTSRYLPWYLRRSMSAHFAYREWAQIALVVANQFPGGDYFEFGSESFRTFRNFLSAFDLSHRPGEMLDTRFYAFDVFGEPKADEALDEVERRYFAVYKDLGTRHYEVSQTKLKRHGLFLDRCHIIKGHFEDTLNEDFKEQLRSQKRRIGFAFLDCNIPSSYKTCLDFIGEFVNQDRVFIYLDEYFQIKGAADLFDDFSTKMRETRGLKTRFVRDAGGFGALFCLMS
jgi:hypothetical protein